MLLGEVRHEGKFRHTLDTGEQCPEKAGVPGTQRCTEPFPSLPL